MLFGIAIALGISVEPTVVIVAGLIAFGVIFALNSAVHSYLILAYADGDKVAMNVGFSCMANAGGRLAGTVLSQWHACRESVAPSGESGAGVARRERSVVPHGGI